MVLIDDIVVGLAAAVTTASLVVLATLLAKYRGLVKEATKSSDLAKNVWDSMNSRLAVQDTRDHRPHGPGRGLLSEKRARPPVFSGRDSSDT